MWRYLPDLPPDTPETWRVCDGFHPDRNGVYRTGFMAADTTLWSGGALDAYMTGRAYQPAAGGTGIVMCRPHTGASQVWQVYSGSSWSDRTGTAGNAFGPSAIAQYGNITLVGDGSGLRYRDATGTSNFATVSGGPVCNIVLVTPRNIVVAFYGSSDAWYASDVGDYTNWATGEYATGNLRQTPGNVTAAAVFGNDVIALKDRGVYRGQYVGGQVKWAWDLVPGGEHYGAFGPECATNAAGALYFLGNEGFVCFDGSRFTRLDTGIWATLMSSVIGASAGRSAHLQYDPVRRLVHVFNFGAQAANGAPPTTFLRSGKSPAHFTFQIDTGQWGYQSKVLDGTNDISGLIGDGHLLNSVNSSSGWWTYNASIFLISATSDHIEVLDTEFASSNSGSTYKPKLRTYRYGDRKSFSKGTRFVPGWTTSGGAGTDLSGATVKTGQPYGSSFPAGSETAIGSAATLSGDGYWVDFTAARRFQSVELQINCEACIDGGEFAAGNAGSN